MRTRTTEAIGAMSAFESMAFRGLLLLLVLTMPLTTMSKTVTSAKT